MKRLMVIGGVVIALAVPAIAQMAMPDRAMMGPVTRAQAEAKVREAFAKADLNHDGYVTTDEIKAAHDAQRTDHDAKMFDEIDTDHNGSISRAEFAAHHAHMGPGGDHAMADGANEVSRTETDDGQGHKIVRVMAMHGGGEGMLARDVTKHGGRLSLNDAVKDALARFDMADTNHDGTVTPEERRAAMQAMMSRMRGMQGGGAHMMDDMPLPPPVPATPPK